MTRKRIAATQVERSGRLQPAPPVAPHFMDNRPITELTVRELQELIRQSVKTSVAEAMAEFALEADAEAQVVYEAELNDRLRQEMRSGGRLAFELVAPGESDD